MRDIPPSLAAQLASGATTLCTCWVLTRSDGRVLGFTDHDAAVVLDGVSCSPQSGFDAGELPRRAGGQVDTGEVVGLLSDVAITAADIAAGVYDGAEVAIWRVDWQSPATRVLLARASIGEIVRDDGGFRAELRSGQAALNRVQGRVFGLFCDAQLGDRRCGVAASHPQFAAGCDRQFATCRDRFANTLNFRGFPHVPGTDLLLRLATSAGANTGKALYQ